MTTAEFKLSNPDKAHLEGDELWNAMEDAIMQPNGLVPKKTLEDVQKEMAENPDDWVTETLTLGDETYSMHFKKSFLDKFNMDEPKPQKEYNMQLIFPSQNQKLT